MRSKQRDLRGKLLVLLMVILPACAGQLSPRVGLKQSAADLVFGIPPLEEPVAPADTISQSTEIKVLSGPRGFSKNPIPGASQSCPDAEFNTVDKEAGFSVEGVPKEGQYRWKLNGDRLIVGLAGRYPLAKFQTREIIDVKRIDAKNFTYTTVQNEVASPTIKRTTYQVINESLTTPLGVYLLKITSVKQTERGLEEQRPFSPNPPVLLLPLPVTLGSRFSSQGVDPSTLQALQHSALVRSWERYDACGKIVDGIFVDADQTFAGDETYSRNYDYAIATQFGGMIVFEHVESPCGSYDAQQKKCVPDAEIRYDANIGQLEPTPFK